MGELADANDIEDIDHVQAGDALDIPVTSTGYTVAPGDTLGEIARAFGVPVEGLLTGNDLSDPDEIVAGSRLTILLPGSSDAIPERMRNSTRLEPHVVQPGESLSRLAARYGISTGTLAQRNGLANPDHIQAGQAIVLRRPSFSYTIEQGDTLSGIAATFALSMETLVSENGIFDPARIFAGGELVIPSEVPVASERIGESRHGRAISAFTIGTGDDRIVLVGGLHAGPEAESSDIVQALFNHFGQAIGALPAGTEIVFLPRTNPDAYAAGSRLNALGVDLNRNWPAENWSALATHGDTPVSGGLKPLSEPETAALYAFLVEHAPDLVLSYHGYAALIEDNGVGAASALAPAYAESADYEHIDEWPYYVITGQFIDAMAEAGIAAADIELAQDDPAAFERNLLGLAAAWEELAAR